MKNVCWEDKVVWITGASSGIGAALAVQLNDLGATVIASARRAEKLDELKRGCPRPRDLMTLPLDITDPRSIERAIAQVRTLIRLDLVLHNAGISQKGLVSETKMEVDRQIMETNYFGTVALTKAVMPLFAQQGYGWFGVVSSFAGVMGIPGRSAYAASKHALHGFFKSLRTEKMDCALDVSFILPGFVHTGITAKGLCGDGKPYGKVETSHRLGMTPDGCARDIIKGLQRKRRRIIVGKMETHLLSIHRISPALGHYIIKSHPMRRIRRLKRHFTFRKRAIVERPLTNQLE